MDSNSDKYAQKEAAYQAACVTGAEMGSGMAGVAFDVNALGCAAPGTAYPTYRQFGHFETADQQLRAVVLHTTIEYAKGTGVVHGPDDILLYAEAFLSFIKDEAITGAPTA